MPTWTHKDKVIELTDDGRFKTLDKWFDSKASAESYIDRVIRTQEAKKRAEAALNLPVQVLVIPSWRDNRKDPYWVNTCVDRISVKNGYTLLTDRSVQDSEKEGHAGYLYPRAAWIQPLVERKSQLENELRAISAKLEKVAVKGARNRYGSGKMSDDEYPDAMERLEQHLQRAAEAAKTLDPANQDNKATT